MITGRGNYVGNIVLPHMLHMSIARSQYAHARLKSVDVSKSLRVDGVVRAFVGEDLIDSPPLPADPEWIEKGAKTPPYRPLAVGKVRFVGEAVAAVLAEDQYAARDALDLIDVAYEPLQAVTDPEAALSPQAPVLHEELGDNLAYTTKYEAGDVEAAFSDAHVRVEGRFSVPRVAPIPLEPRCIVASYNPSTEYLTAWISTQLPHRDRSRLSRLLGIPDTRIRVIAPDVGGGFGSKLNLYPEYYLACLLSVKTGRPVKWVSDRREDFLANGHGRAMVAEFELAANREGEVLGLRGKILGDLGAYTIDTTQAMPPIAARMITGCYRIPNVSITVYAAYTNGAPVSAYRGAGRPEATYWIERMMHRLAEKLGMSQHEVRLKNFVPPEAFPYRNYGGLKFDSGNYAEALRKALDISGYYRITERKEELSGSGRLIGVGMSSYVEITSIGWESATVRVEPSGKVIVFTGASPHGQGELTTFAQIAADELGVDLDDVSVVHGDTLAVQHGFGTGGSRTLTLGGAAIKIACSKIREQAIRIAAHLLEANVEDVVYEAGKLHVVGLPDKYLTLSQIAEKAYNGDVPQEMMGLQSTSFFNNEYCAAPFGTHVAVVEVDPETGVVEVRKAVLVDDCGKVVNPMLVEGQVVGGAIQALGEALYEEVIYSPDGQLLNASLADYMAPTAMEAPHIEIYRTETPGLNPLGTKGVGEAATIGLMPAIANAVEDALKPLGAKPDNIPLKPEYVWSLTRKATTRGE